MVPFHTKRPALEIVQGKILQGETLEKRLNVARFGGKRIVLTNGCFDILHRGHLDYLAKASDLGDVLVIGVNSDASVRQLGKGASRPIQDEQSRAQLIAALHFVDAVVIFEETTPENLIKMVQPDILVKGADYDANEINPESKKFIVGSDLVRRQGGEVRTIEFLEGYSTSAIEQRIKA